MNNLPFTKKGFLPGIPGKNPFYCRSPEIRYRSGARKNMPSDNI